jgi:membrane-anchored protein YejM (alkaline phosphatase superfamily)
VWADAVTLAIKEMGTADFPENCPWTMNEVLSQHGLLAVCS